MENKNKTLTQLEEERKVLASHRDHFRGRVKHYEDRIAAIDVELDMRARLAAMRAARQP